MDYIVQGLLSLFLLFLSSLVGTIINKYVKDNKMQKILHAVAISVDRIAQTKVDEYKKNENWNEKVKIEVLMETKELVTTLLKKDNIDVSTDYIITLIESYIRSTKKSE